MSWLYSRVLVAEYLGDICLDGAPCALWNGTPTLRPSWLPARMTDACRLSRSGMMYKPLTADRGEELLTLYLAGFRAKTYRCTEKEQELEGKSQACGDTWPESLAKYDPNLRLWKTRQCLLLGGLATFSETWPKWGMIRNGEFFPQERPERLTFEKEYSYSLPTMLATEYAGAATARHRNSKILKSLIHSRVAQVLRNSETCPNLLHPSFGERIMGFPVQWTDLNASAMLKFREWQQWHFVI